jgi:chromosome segregation ATPase
VQSDLSAAELREADAKTKVADIENVISQTQSALRQRSAEASDLHQELEQARAAITAERQRREALSEEKAALDTSLSLLREAMQQRELEFARNQDAITNLQANIVRQSKEHQAALREKEAIVKTMLNTANRTTDKLRSQVDILVRGLATEKHVYFQRKKSRLERNAALLKSAAVIDETWYLSVNEDVAKSGIDPTVHYLAAGVQEGRAVAPS